MKRITACLSTLLLMSGVFSQQMARAEPNPPLKLGALMTLTGEFAMQGEAFREGVELALEEVNAAGGVAGQPLRVVIEDTHSAAQVANTAARKLIDIDKVIGALTVSYPETEVGGAQFQRSRIPTIALWDSSPDIDKMGDYIFAIGPWTPSDAEVGAAYCEKALHAKTAVIVNTVEPWSELISDLFTQEFGKHGGKIRARFKVNPGESDFRTILAKVRSINPDVMYAPLTSEVVAFHSQRLIAGLQAPVLSSGIITPEHIAQNPPAFEGVYQTGIQDPDRPETKLLAKKYRAHFKKELSMPWFVATGHDAILLFAHAIATVGPHPEEIKDFLYTVRNFRGAAQDISISAGGSSPYYASMFQVRDKKLQPVP